MSESRNLALQLLRSPFKWLFYSNLANSIGVELRLMAQSWLILELGGSQMWLGAANGLRIIPFFLASLIAGLLIDRVGGRTILLWDRLGLLIIAALTAVVVLADVVQVWHVVALSVASGGVIALGVPSSNTLVTELVPRERLQTANSLNTFTFSIARALGPMDGGVLVAAMGLAAPWLALVALYTIAALCTLGLPKVQMAPIDETSGWTRLNEGLRYVRTHPIISRIMLLAFSLLVGSTIMPIWPVYARDRFDVGSSGFGWMMAVFALGQGLSALYITGRSNWSRQSVPILYASTIWSICMVVFGFSTSYSLSLVALFCMGTAVPPWMTSLTTLLQTKSDRAMLGRVMAVYGMSMQVGMFGWFIGGWVGELIGNDWMLLITGVTFFLLHFALILTSKELRQA